MNKVITLGYYMPSRYESSRVLYGGGVTPTMKDNHGTINAVLIKRRQEKTLISARLLKHDGVNYLPQDQHKIGEVGGAVSNTIHAHYSKGASNHKDVLIIVKTNEYLQD